MNPPLPPSSHRPSPARGVSAGPAPAGAAAGGTRLSTGAAALLLAAAAIAVACVTAYLLALAFGVAHPLLAVLAAALGVAAGAAPLAWLLAQLSRAGGRAPSPVSAAGVAAGDGGGVLTFAALAQREFSRARRHGSGAALLLVDVDHRPPRADGLASAVPAMLAELLRQTAPTLRSADVLAQQGPSRVAVFLAPADATGALDVAERIRDRAEQLRSPLSTLALTPPPRITVSIGVAPLRASHATLQALAGDAEQALALARQAGGNCVRSAPADDGGEPPPAPGPWQGQPPRARRRHDGAA